MNDQRRENLEFRLKEPYETGDIKYSSDGKNPDPLLKGGMTMEARDAYAMDLRNDLTTEQEKLIPFYQTYLTRKLKKGDARTADKVNLYTKFEPTYYFLGLNLGAMNNNQGIEQTIGWSDTNNGNAPGTFDPLAEPAE